MRGRCPRFLGVSARRVSMPHHRRSAEREALLGALLARNLQHRARVHPGSRVPAQGHRPQPRARLRGAARHPRSHPLPPPAQATMEHLRVTTASVVPSIVLVEDDLRLAELVSRYLENNGFRVTSTARGDHAVDQVRRSNPDLLILDLSIPGKDGFEVCRQLRPVYVNPILILTARNSDIDHV